MVGLVVAASQFAGIKLPEIFAHPSLLSGLIALAILAAVMIKVPLANAGRADEPAPPTAIM
jgi:hypothetical protein